MNHPITRRGVLGATAVGAAVAASSTLAAPAAHAQKPETLRVLAINIWFGGTVIEPGLELVTAVIRQTRADVVLLSESGESTAKLAAQLSTAGESWRYAESSDTGVLSRYPILETGQLPFITKAVIDIRGRQVACYAAHFEYRWYATYLPRGYGGGSASGPFEEYGWGQIPTGPVDDVDAILADNLRSGRPRVIDTFLTDAADERSKGRSVLLGGDFNEPSVLDWTAATKDLYDHHGLVIPWQSTQKLAEAGFIDAYRTIYPNPVTHPGMTWPADNPLARLDQLAWAPKADERDRIDYIFTSPMPGLKLLDAGIVGPAGSIVRNERRPDATDDVLSSPTPWPTDHKAVLASYRLTGPKAKRR
ncbi:endonuclease/exonuclease/phosphatase family protein [Luteococcus sp. H138]|uniref:endonuclease/exonuclease/phosphatase family protein n=1 Tax=unclassified Luteococcus TaxID=2639923 RepID=UPI00313AD28F